VKSFDATTPPGFGASGIAVVLSLRPAALVQTATGRPIVATDVTGSREVARDGIKGLLGPRGDVDAAARALARLAGDAALRARMGAAAHARFMERFTEAAVIRAMTEFHVGLSKTDRLRRTHLPPATLGVAQCQKIPTSRIESLRFLIY
jgi:Glycosyl transferases group 1